MEVSSKNNLFYFFEYDVFLCFHGEDTREAFASYLRDYLLEKGIKTFMDVQLPNGRPTPTCVLIEKILKSKLSVVIFSENFASSESCLQQLAMILECKEALALEVLPVFYKVKISELKRQEVGRTAEYLAKHDMRHGGNAETVVRWRRAVQDLSGINGLSHHHGVELKFIQKIVETVSKTISRKNRMQRRMGKAFDLLKNKIVK